ncbi:stalk domain-containing protein [Chengkuizengella axinellae]|uniref:Stalk domain-containing protein n=1 Tax=Chengkuizengella axinellae TaxID=3064388 RepID=A0ABT9J471_9BACL|nr:stalk domain-containing protein [Chengkuizengella sp. 2205SS18-9]MDP5276395.1 stalk domain-containing protein [Chengkuizengella sp. 2205SS18-9]
MKKNAMIITLAGTLLIGGAMQPSLANQFPLQGTNMTSQLQLAQSIEQVITIKEHDLSFENDEVAVNAILPEIQGLIDKEFQKEINEKIKKKFEQNIEEIKSNAEEFAEEAKENDWTYHKYTLDMNYDMKLFSDIVSIVINSSTYTGGANANSTVDSVNIVNQAEAEEVSASDLMDLELINEFISNEIAKNPELYFTGDSGFEGIREDQAFYVENAKMVFIFNEYEIASGNFGTPKISIAFENERMDHTYGEEVTSPDEISIVINGEVQSYAQSPVIMNDTTLVPLRGIFEELGAVVKWNNESKTVTAEKDDVEILLTVGEDAAQVNGKSITLLQPSKIIEGSTMVPLRFVSEAFGADVNWNQDTRTVTIKTN